MRTTMRLGAWLLGVNVCALVAAVAADLRWDSVGSRVGLSATPMSLGLVQPELFATADLPMRWHLSPHWYCQPRVDLSAGALQWRGTVGFIGAAGPVAVVGHDELPVSLGCGISPTVLSRYDFRVRNFGFPVQFTSHVDFAWDISDRWRFTFRFQHMSNGGLSLRNPGLNLYNVGLGWKF